MNTFANNPAGRWMGIPKGTGAQPGNALKQKELKQLLAQKKQQLPCPLFSWRRSDVEHRLDFISFCESFGYMIYDAFKTSDDYHVCGYLAQPNKDIEYALYSDINTNNFGQLSVFGQSPFGEYRSLPQLWVQCVNKSLADEEKKCVRSLFVKHMYTIKDYVNDNKTWQELTLDKNIQVTEGTSIEIIDEESDDEESDEVTGEIAWDNDGTSTIDVYLDEEDARFIAGNVVRIGKKRYTIESIQELPVKEKNIAKHSTTEKKYGEFLADNEDGVDMSWLESVQKFNESNMNDNMLDKGRLFVGFDGTNLADFVQRFLAVMVLEKSDHLTNFKKLMKRIRKNATLSEKKTMLPRQIERLGAEAYRLRNKNDKKKPWVPVEKRKKELKEELNQFKDISPIDFAKEKEWMASLATEALPYLIDYLFVFGPQRTVETYQKLIFEQDMSLNGGDGGYLPRVEIMTSVVKALKKDSTTDIELVINKHHFYNFMQNVHFSPQNQGLHTVHGLFDKVTRFVSSMPFKEWKTLVGNDADGVAIAKNLHEFMRYEISGTGDEKKPIGGRKKGCEIMQQLLFHVEDAYNTYNQGDYPIFTLKFDEKKSGSVILSLIGKDDDVELMEIDDVIPGDTNGAYTNGAYTNGAKKSNENKSTPKKRKYDGAKKKVNTTPKKREYDGAKKKNDTTLKKKTHGADVDGSKKNKEVGVYLEVALSKIEQRRVSNNQMFVELYDYLYLIVRSKMPNRQQYHDHWHQGNENLNSTAYKTLMQRFESHELVQVTDDNVIVVEFANVNSKELFTNAFKVLDTASSSSTIPHPTFDWNIRWKNMAQWNEENEKIAYDQLFEPFQSFTIEKWFHGERKLWMDMTDTNFPVGIPIVLQLKQKTGLKRKELENKQEKEVNVEPPKKKAKINTGDVILVNMSNDLPKDFKLKTDGVVVCFFGDIQNANNSKSEHAQYNSWLVNDLEALNSKYEEVMQKKAGGHWKKNVSWLANTIKKKDRLYKMPKISYTSMMQRKLSKHHNRAENGVQLTFDVDADKDDAPNNDNVVNVSDVYNNVVDKKTPFLKLNKMHLMTQKSLVFKSTKFQSISMDKNDKERYSGCLLVPFGSMSIEGLEIHQH